MGDAVTKTENQVGPPIRSGAMVSAASRVVVAVTGTAVTILVAHLLGPSGIGSFTIAQTLLVLTAALATLGTEHGIVYFVSSGRWHPIDAMAASQKVALGGGAVAALVCIATRWLLPGAFDGLSFPLACVCAASLPFVLASFYAGYVALASGGITQYAGIAATQGILVLLFVGGMGLIDGLAGAVIGLALSQALTTLAWVPAAWKRLRHLQSRASASAGGLRPALIFGIKGWAANALQLINYRVDLFILSAVADRAAVGHYAVAVSATAVLWLLPQALSDVLYPAIARRATEPGTPQLAESESKSLRHCALLTTAGSAIVVLALLTLVIPIFGPAFRASTDLGLTLLPGTALVAMTNPLGAIITGRGRPDLMLRTTATVVPVTVGLYVVLIPALHAEGAALGSTISYSLSFVLVTVAYGRLIKANPVRQMLPTLSELADYRALAQLMVHRLSPGTTG